MPRRWTNANQWTGDSPSLRALASELHRHWNRRHNNRTDEDDTKEPTP